jgi:putative membrane protein
MINSIANITITVVAILHLWFCILEIFLWQKPLGLRIFRMQKTFATQSASLAANQGIYNGFLCAGLIWGIFSNDPIQALHVKIFFLSCVIIAGIFAGITVSKRILFIQAFPAAIALALLNISF